MLMVDFLILNRDRHGANIEVLRNSCKKTIHLAPLFDHGLSLLFSCKDDAAAAKYDVMADKRVNNYIGSGSTLENLKLIPKDKFPKVFRYKKPGKRGIMPTDKATYYNKIDIGIFLLFMEKCLKHEKLDFERILFSDDGDEEKTLIATYVIK